MNRKSIIITLILLYGLIFTITTCELLNKELKIILPSYLFDGDPNMSRANGIIQLFDYESEAMTIELAIIPADADSPDNQNNDSDDLSQYLLIPSSVSVPADQLYVEFECTAIDTEMTDPYYKDATVKASAFRFNDAQDTIRIHDIATGETPEPTEVPTPTPEDTPTPDPTATP